MTLMTEREAFLLDYPKLVAEPVPCIYAIRHTQTKACWIGLCALPLAAWDNWFYRLRNLDTHPPLNWAMRAIYTMRSDWEMLVLEEFTPNTREHDQLTRLGIWIEKNKSRGRQFDLNIGKSTLDRAWWAALSGEAWRFTKKPRKASVKKVKLYPRRVKITPEDTQALEALPEETGNDALAAINELRASQGKTPIK